ncbi:hypothetical protein ACEPPN_000372 [Leptodophora sp. 'Broadleaf-Isolate-01']
MLKNWEEAESARIATLADKILVVEVALIMSGQTYSWYAIGKRLKRVGIVNVFYCQKWTALCERKAEWDAMAVQSGNVTSNSSVNSIDESAVILDHLTRSQLWHTNGFRTLLFDLKRVPIYAGLGTNGRL